MRDNVVHFPSPGDRRQPAPTPVDHPAVDLVRQVAQRSERAATAILNLAAGFLSDLKGGNHGA